MSKMLTFIQHYQMLRESNPAKQFIMEIAELTHKSPKTVKQWLTGKQRPDKLTIAVIADYMKVDPDILFPPPVSE